MPDRVHADRARAESFGAAAEQYEQSRPSYPAALVDDILAGRPATALDVGCGTGKLGRLLAARGVAVIGVEVDSGMAAVARRVGLTVEVSSFEAWDPGGRAFDVLVSGQAWHWIDPVAGPAKAGAALRPGGTAVLAWNGGDLDEEVRAALDAVYRREAPDLLVAASEARARDDRPPYAGDLSRSGLFTGVESRSYTWEASYSTQQWLDLLGTHSDHLTLDPGRRERVVAGLRAVIDRLGGRVAAHYVTRAVFARRAG